MQDSNAVIVKVEPVENTGTEIQKTPIKKKSKKKTAANTVELVAEVLKKEADQAEPELTPQQIAINRRIVEWNKRKEKEKEKIRVRFRDYFTPNIIRTIQWQAYKDWPVNMWKVRDGDIITMDRASIRGLTEAAKKKILEPFNDKAFPGAQSTELSQTKYIEKTVQVYGFESLEFDSSFSELTPVQILKPRSEVIFAQ